jgi:hypothetical protein
MEPKEPKETRSSVIVPLRLTAQPDTTDRRGYLVTFIQAGRVKRRDGKDSLWEIPASTLQAAVPLLDARPSFLDHYGWLEGHPALKDLAGVTFQPAWNAETQSIDGGIRVYDSPAGNVARSLFDQIVADQGAGLEVPDVGLSLVFFDRVDYLDIGDQPGEQYLQVSTEITHVESVDFVFGPGANGRVREILSSVAAGWEPRLPTADGRPPEMKGVIVPQGGTEVTEERAEYHVESAPEVTAPTPAPDVAGQLAALSAQVERLTAAVALAVEPRVVQGMGVAPAEQRPRVQVQGMWDTADQIALAYEQLMGLPVSQPVHRLSGIRELYILLTGDRDMKGIVDLDLVPRQLAYSSSGANADTTTMAELTRNIMNKVLVQQIDLLDEYRWWEKIARVDDFNNLQQVAWIKYGGIGYATGTGLPTVAEKGEYQQLYWEDERATADWVKKGGYLPLSLEMVDRDDLAAWRDVPRQLATAEVVTLSSVISALFTDNDGLGPAMGDGIGDGYAFNTTRGNLITQPLDQTNWNTAIDTMYKLSQLMHASVSETRRIATRPKYVLVPIELESQAVTSIVSLVKPTTPADLRPIKRILPEENIVVVPHWTNADRWAAIADPLLLPFVGVGFRFGRVPELIAEPTGGAIQWLHDVFPIKVRWFFAVGVVETRGAIKSNP